MAKAVASIDIGTNSTRLLVAEPVVDQGRDPARNDGLDGGPGGALGSDLVGAVGEPGDAVVLRTVERLMRITRLGQGVDGARGLAPEAIERTLAVLRGYREVLDRFAVDPTRIRMAATSASRDAANRDEFFDAAEAIIGVRPCPPPT